MSKNKVLFRVLLVCICITFVVGCLGLGAFATSAANPVLQVNDAASSAELKDGMIQVVLAQKDVFTYNEILDLSTASKNVPLLNMQFNPAEIGMADATRVKLRFTDLYDENNYITISLNHLTDDWAKSIIYMTAGAAHQSQVGVENGKVHTDDIYGYGAAVDFSLSGVPGSPEDVNLTLYFDYNEKAIYVDRETYSKSRQLVVDLDNPNHFPGNLWSGFTTGHVKMTVFASNYQSATCNFTISAINGNSQFRDDDQSAPIISVHTGYEQDAIPVALVGKPYPIFNATAIDGCDGNVETTAKVYYENTAGSTVEVAVEDGKFTPSEEGVYVIEYTAQDLSGNASTASLRVNAVVGDGLQVTLQDVVSETDTGVPVQVLSGIDCVGATGNVSYRVTAKNVTTGDEATIDTQTHSFIPMVDGDWEITVTVQDYISTVVETFTVKVNRTSQPQVYDTVGIPNYFVQGATYQLPVLYAYDFSSGKAVLTPMDVYVTENGSSETAVANGQYTPANEGAVTVTYRLTVDGKTCEKSYAATVVKVKNVLNTVNLGKYFVDPTGAATSSAASSKITYTFKKDTKLDFVNFVQVKQLTFAFQVGSQKAYNKISVYLTDIISGKQVKLSYNKTANGVTFSVNDGGAITLTSAFDSSFSLAFSGDTGIVIPETGKEIKVKNFLDGSEFTGFTDSVARFAVELSGVTGSSQFAVQTLNGQKMSYATKDSVAPQFIAKALSGTIERGEKLQLKGAFVYDVLDPIATVTLKVTDPDGVAVIDENGVTLNGTQDASKDTAITMEKLGTYTIFYTTVDGKKNTGRHIYTITVTDGEGPTITLLEHTKSVKPGETVTIAGTQVQDNITGNCTVVSYVFNPEGVNIPVTNGTFEASMQGVYTVKYMAFDGDGNYTFASYEVSALPEKVNYLNQSMSLGSDLTLHLWGNVPQGYENSISGTLTYGDTAQSFKLGELSQAENGLYHMQAEMAVAQMTENIELVLSHKVIGEAVRKNYTVRDYLVALIEGDYDQQTKDLCLELLNMGAWAQMHFDHNISNLANADYSISPANAIPEESPKVQIEGAVDGIAFYGTSVRFLSQTAVRFYFKANGAVNGYTFTLDGKEYEPVEKDGLYFIETPGINPQDMSQEITVNVTDGTDTLSVTYVPMWYFIRTHNKSNDTTTKNLMAAAYSYYKEAEDYVPAAVTPDTAVCPESPTGEGVYICVDLLITSLGNSTDSVDIAFYPYDFEGDINNYTDKIAITAGTTTTVKLNAEKYMVDGVIPDGLGIAIFGGPAWDDKLSDGYTPDRHTLTISNARLTGAWEGTLDLSGAEVNTGKNGTGYTNANDSGVAYVIDDAIVITGGFRYDGHKISLGEDTSTYLNMDMLITTLSNSTESVEVRFYPHNFDGNVHEEYTDKIVVTAGTATSIRLNVGKYLVDGQLLGIGVAIFGGPEWNTQISNGVYDRHRLTISNMRLEGALAQTIDLNEATVTTGFAKSNSGGTASIVDGKIVATNGYRYDGHMITFDSNELQQKTYISLDMLMTTLSNSTDPVEVAFFPSDFEGDINDETDIITITAGTTASIKLDAAKYLVDGQLSGIGFAIYGGPTWDAKLEDGYTPDRHTLTISNVHLEGGLEQSIDLSDVAVASGTNGTGYTNANGSGVATVVDGAIVITGGFRFDGHKLTFGSTVDME